MLRRNLPSPVKGASSRSTSGLLEGGRVGVWPAMPYSGTEETGKSTISACLWMLVLEHLSSLGICEALLAGKPLGSGVAREYRKQKRGYLALGQILSQAWSTKQFRSTLGCLKPE